jgi:hypothetical protein
MGTYIFPSHQPSSLLIPFCEISAQWAARLHLNASWDEELRPSEGSPVHFQLTTVIRKFFVLSYICRLGLLLPNCHITAFPSEEHFLVGGGAGSSGSRGAIPVGRQLWHTNLT